MILLSSITWGALGSMGLLIFSFVGLIGLVVLIYIALFPDSQLVKACFCDTKRTFLTIVTFLLSASFVGFFVLFFVIALASG